MDAIEEMLTRKRAERFDDDAYVYWTVVPAFRGANIVWRCPKWPGLMLSWAREPFDREMASTLVRHVNDCWNGVPSATGITILHDLPRRDLSGMDTAFLLSPTHHQRLREEGDVLHAQTIVAFPGFHEELSGTESPRLFDELIHAWLPIGNWNRKLDPRLVAWHWNARPR